MKSFDSCWCFEKGPETFEMKLNYFIKIKYVENVYIDTFIQSHKHHNHKII